MLSRRVFMTGLGVGAVSLGLNPKAASHRLGTREGLEEFDLISAVRMPDSLYCFVGCNGTSAVHRAIVDEDLRLRLGEIVPFDVPPTFRPCALGGSDAALLLSGHIETWYKTQCGAPGLGSALARDTGLYRRLGPWDAIEFDEPVELMCERAAVFKRSLGSSDSASGVTVSLPSVTTGAVSVATDIELDSDSLRILICHSSPEHEGMPGGLTIVTGQSPNWHTETIVSRSPEPTSAALVGERGLVVAEPDEGVFYYTFDGERRRIADSGDIAGVLPMAGGRLLIATTESETAPLKLREMARSGVVSAVDLVPGAKIGRGQRATPLRFVPVKGDPGRYLVGSETGGYQLHSIDA